MVASEILGHLRAEFPACSLVALADLSTDMVLATSAAQEMPQERWDGLCQMAQDVLRGPSAAGALSVLNSTGETSLARAALINVSECDIFLTAQAAPDFVLCAVAQAHLDVTAFYDAAQPLLDRLVQDD